VAPKHSLADRSSGFQFSGTEQTLIFEKDNIGFVRFDGRSKTRFYLDPSPFLKTPKNEVYILENCAPPEEGDLIEVTSTESDSEICGSYGNYKIIKVKYVCGWERRSPNSYIRSKGIDPEDYINFFNRPFSGAPEYMEQLSFCLALCTMSSPTIGSNGKGGIDSGIYAKKDSWGSYRRLMSIVPKDFRDVHSRFYYNQFDKEKELISMKSEEVNIAVLDPLRWPVHVPISFNTDIRRVADYKEDLDYEIPLLRAYLLDSLMFKPEPTSKSVEKHLIDLIYDMVAKFTSYKSISYNIDLGSAAPKFCSAFARLRLSEKISKAEVDECGILWMDMFHHSIRVANSNLSPQKLFSLTPQAFQLYHYLENIHDVGVRIPISEVYSSPNINPWEIEEAIATLRKIGAIYSPTNQYITLIDFQF
jgi:hypothetical protein